MLFSFHRSEFLDVIVAFIEQLKQKNVLAKQLSISLLLPMLDHIDCVKFLK